jgi:hypothetical protein
MGDALVVIDVVRNLGEVCSNYMTRQSMADDKWLADLSEELRRSRNPAQVRDIIERIEDQYDAFSGPGEEWIEQLLQSARNRLAQMLAELAA